jgi:preprotein translocase subunit SecB
MSKINDDSHSALKLREIFVDKQLFERKDDTVKKVYTDTEINFKRVINDMEDNKFKVSLSINLSFENKYIIEVCLSGIFQMEEEVKFKNKILLNNTVAILFPYLRSQLSLLTSQPGFEPVILPAININRLLDEQ